MLQISDTTADFQREPLLKPFGFKGGYLSEIWQSSVTLTDEADHTATGLGTQSVLWSDASVFASTSEAAGNALMFAVTEFALQRLKGQSFDDPMGLQEAILDEVHAYAYQITGRPNLRKTFTLNALVPVDFAAWLLHAQASGITSLDDLIPEAFRPALAAKHSQVASIPLVSYNTPLDQVEALLDEGFFFLKIKLGAPGTQEEMVEQDMARLTALHNVLTARSIEHTEDGRIPYYLDANGRYETKKTLQRFLDHADAIGALERIVILEEPFLEELDFDVSDLPVRLAADESAHTDGDALKRIQQGYGAIALKPIAKTLSMTLKIAGLAHQHQIPCFCADLTVNPILVEWNKAIAARLAPFPGLGMALLETNGHQNYRNWDAMRTCLPDPEAKWTHIKAGVFELDENYYAASGNVLIQSPCFGPKI